MDAIVVGADGLEPSLVERFVAAGELPAMADLRETGAYGTAACSSIVSATQWTTHLTGVGPDRHGVDGFVRRDQQSIERDDRPETRVSPDARTLITTADVGTLTYPEYLAERGYSVGLINPLPVWPPLELEGGFCVAGMVAPPGTDRVVHPPGMAERLERFGYRIDVQYGDRPYGFVDDALFADDEVSLAALREDLFDVMDARVAFTKHAAEEVTPDLLFTLLKTPDVVQHAFWAHMAADRTDFADAILESYRRVDDLLGWLRRQYPDANLLVFGDHGFGPRQDPRSNLLHSLGWLANRALPLPYRVKAFYREHFKSESTVEDLTDPDGISGDHSTPTAWMAAGPDVGRAAGAAVDFEDFAPTALALAGAEVPEAYAGRPLPSLTTSPAYCEADLSVRRSRAGIDREVSERLYDLGYADMVQGRDGDR